MRKNAILFLILSIGLMQAVLAQELVSNSTNVKPYLLTPGDEIITKVMGEKDFDFEAIVDENGNIEVPYFDTPIKAMCKTERELRLEVAKMLGKYLRNPQISLRAKDRNQNRPEVSVFGEVKTNQKFILMRQYRLKEMLAQVGGTSESAGGIVMVTHTKLPMCASEKEVAEWNAISDNKEGGQSSRIYNLADVETGRDELNPIIYPGDIIQVPTAKPVYVVGQVKAPQGIYIKGKGLSLFQAINQLGGPEKEAKTKDVKIYRLKSDSSDDDKTTVNNREILSVNYDLIRKGEQPDVMLQPYDIVEVDKAKKSIAVIIMEMAMGGARTAFQGVSGGIGTKLLY
jgi:protein involved in polysaccharide export with SLBB domain